MKKAVVMFVILLMSLSTFAINTGSRASERENVTNVAERENDAPVRTLDFHPTMSYQGLLKDNDGKLIEDGKYNLTFKIYDAQESEAAIWKEVQEVEITSGIINCFIGAEEKLDLPFDRQYWLSVGVNDEELPRMIMTGTPYSLHARRIAEDAIVGGKNISVSKDEDGKIVLSGVESGIAKGDYPDHWFQGTNDYSNKMSTCTASGQYSLASGFYTSATSIGSTSMGGYSTAGGNYSTAMGYHNLTSNNHCYAFGQYSTASGYNSSASGTFTTASANYSFVFGRGVSDTERLENNIERSFMVGFDSTTPTLFVKNNAVCIGRTEAHITDGNETALLSVEGRIAAKSVYVTTDNWADYVFKDDYNLKSLESVEEFISQNNHLPGIIPEKEALEKGINMNEFQIKLLEKIEELTLYSIEQNNRIKKLELLLEK